MRNKKENNHISLLRNDVLDIRENISINVFFSWNN